MYPPLVYGLEATSWQLAEVELRQNGKVGQPQVAGRSVVHASSRMQSCSHVAFSPGLAFAKVTWVSLVPGSDFM